MKSTVLFRELPNDHVTMCHGLWLESILSFPTFLTSSGWESVFIKQAGDRTRGWGHLFAPTIGKWTKQACVWVCQHFGTWKPISGERSRNFAQIGSLPMRTHRLNGTTFAWHWPRGCRHWVHQFPEAERGDSIFYGSLVLRNGMEQPTYGPVQWIRPCSGHTDSWWQNFQIMAWQHFMRFSNRGAAAVVLSRKSLAEMVWKPLGQNLSGVKKFIWSQMDWFTGSLSQRFP